MNSEIWKVVPGWEGSYEVSDAGRVRSVDRVSGGAKYRGRLLSATSDGRGYLHVRLCSPGRKVVVTVHRLVLLAFVGPPPADMETCHGDGVRSNNALANLRYDTRRANAADATRHGNRRPPKGDGHHNAKLSSDAVHFIREHRCSWSRRALAERFGVSRSSIDGVVNGRVWRHV